MKKMMMAVLAASAAFTVASAADAAQGCGPGAHRGPYGGCRPNWGGPGPGPGFVPALGVFYPGHGYWDGHRYWGHRYAWHGGWRYR